MSVVNPLILPSKFSLLEIRKNPKQACKKRKGDKEIQKSPQAELVNDCVYNLAV